MEIKLADLGTLDAELRDEINAKIKGVIDSGNFILGENCRKFEEEFAHYTGVKYAVSCASGTDALMLSLMSIGVARGDDVIVTPYTMFSSVECVERLGANSVFVDIDHDTFNMNPEKIEEKIIYGRTKAIMPVHLFGQSANMKEINKIAKEHELFVIEDACQSHGAEHFGKKVGSLGDTGCFSFFPVKNLGCYGDGGIVTTDNVELFEKLKILRVHGAKEKYNHLRPGLNSRLDEIQAAVLRVKLKYLDKWNDMRIKNASIYDNNLDFVWSLPIKMDGNKHVYHQYTVKIANERDKLRERLKNKGIDTGVYYPIPLHLQKWFDESGYKKVSLPKAEMASKVALSLPVHPSVTENQIKYICDEIRKVNE